MNYIITKHNNEEYIVTIFNECLDHTYFRETFGNIVSAGICKITPWSRVHRDHVGENHYFKVKVSGGSKHLEKKSRPEDAKIIQKFLSTQGENQYAY
jgi:hypothetical protein